MTAAARLAARALTDIVKQQEAWLIRSCAELGLTPERMAELYEIEAEPIVLESRESGLRATQRVRLVRRKADA